MHVLRLLLASVVLLGMSFNLGRQIVIGLKTGSIRTAQRSLVRRAQSPVGYWAIVGLFSALTVFFLGAWVMVLLS